MNRLSLERRAAVLQAFTRHPIRAVAVVAGADTTTCLSTLRLLATVVASWQIGLFGIVVEQARCYIGRVKLGAGVVGCVLIDDSTRLIVGYGVGTSVETAESDALAMASVTTRRIELLGRAPWDFPLPRSNKRPRADVAGAKTAFVLLLTAWNLLIDHDGSSPAYRAGLQPCSWTAIQLVAEATGEKAESANVETPPPSPPTPHPRPMSVEEREARWLGQRYALLVVVARVLKGTATSLRLVRCDCGGFRVCNLTHLRSGATTSCGCRRLVPLFGSRVPAVVRALGYDLSIGQLAALAGMTPTQLMARIARGMDPEAAASLGVT